MEFDGEPSQKSQKCRSSYKPDVKTWAFPISMLAISLLVVYGRVVNNQFIAFDDPLVVTENPEVLQGLSIAGIKWAFTTGHFANWAPLTWLSHQLDVTLFGDWAGGHHLTSLLLHIVGTLAVFFAFAWTLDSPWTAAVAAALYGLHPLHVESAAWISERKGILSSAFGLWAIAVYCRQMRSQTLEKVPRRFVGSWVCLLYAGSLLSKQMLVTLPMLLLLLDHWPLKRRFGRQLFLEKAPLFAMAVVFALIAFAAQSGGNAVSSFSEAPLSARLPNVVCSICRYLVAWIVPTCLGPFYPYVDKIRPEWFIFFGLILLLPIALDCGGSMLKRPWQKFAWLWFFVAILPVCGLIPVGRHGRADRYTDIPLLGLQVALACNLSLNSKGEWRGFRSLTGSVALAWLAILGGLSFVQVSHWHDTESLFTHVLACDPSNYMAHNQIGVLRLDAGKLDKARIHFESAISADPTFAFARINLGRTLKQLGRPQEAERAFASAIQADDSLSLAWHEHGIALAELGQPEAALGELQRACDLNPADGQAWINLGSVQLRLGDPMSAKAALERGLARKPESFQARFDLIRCHIKLGELPQARLEFEQLSIEFPHNPAIARLRQELN